MTEQPTMYFVCPICGTPIEQVQQSSQAMFDLQVEAFDADPLRALMEAAATKQAEADEAVILNHVQMNHSIADVLLALGTARQALLNIVEYLDNSTVWPSHQADLRGMTQRGLGGF